MVKNLFEHTNDKLICCVLQAFNRWGYYPLILIGSWAFATINRLYDFTNPGHKIFWLSFLDVGFAGLMVSILMLVYLILDVTKIL
jgi:cAMP receptor-like G-protein coupled receptor